ncbi:MAG: ribonuclease P protein component [Rickettsiales bacterium]|nr:ribonuclease P protein component [Rickettsiales bacterium]
MLTLFIAPQKPWQKCRNYCIIVPKRFVKKAHDRNKIRRQIRHIIRMHTLIAIQDKKMCVIYQDINQKPSFQELSQSIVAEYIHHYGKLS